MIQRLMKLHSVIGRAALLAAALSPVVAATRAAALPAIAASVSPREIPSFYAARAGRPLWLADKTAATALIALLSSASLDHVNAEALDMVPLDAALAAAEGGDLAAVGRADALLSDRFESQCLA